MTAAAKRTKQLVDWFGGPAHGLMALDPLDAARQLADVAEAAAEAELPRLAELLAGKGAVQGFLGAAFDLSPFLRDCVRRRPEILDGLFDASLDDRLAAINAEIG